MARISTATVYRLAFWLAMCVILVLGFVAADLRLRITMLEDYILDYDIGPQIYHVREDAEPVEYERMLQVGLAR